MTSTDITLTLETRESVGKQYAKRLRREGKIPGVFYAHGEKAIPIVVDARELEKSISQAGGLIDVKIGQKRKRKAIIKDVQHDPMTSKFYHVDIMGVRLKEKVTVTVPIHLVGEPVGVKEQGGILHQYNHDIEVTCLPLDIPEQIEIDVTELKIGDAITLGDIHLENVALVGEEDQPLVSVMAPTVAKATAEEEAAEEEIAEGEGAEEEAEAEEKTE